ncbi:Viral IAP-associated factor, partial [Daphnia magna]
MENPTEDTQWNDVLRQKGIIPPKPKEAEITEEQIENMVENVVKTYTSKEQKPEELELDDLDGLEDELDEKVFLEYRQKRIAEMKASIKSNKFGEVLEITGKDYVQEVNK